MNEEVIRTEDDHAVCFARFGGNEFVLNLPTSGEAAAMQGPERCRDLIFKEQIPHEGSPVGQLLTISRGVGTIIAPHQDEAVRFIEEVDVRLYRRKQAGSTRIVVGR